MMRRQRLLLALLFLTSSVVLPAQAPQTPSAQTPAPAPGRGGGAPLEISTDLTGWIPMFDGVSMKGWDGPMPLWHVEDGAIVVRRPVDPPVGSVYLIWQGGQPIPAQIEPLELGQPAEDHWEFRQAALPHDNFNHGTVCGEVDKTLARACVRIVGYLRNRSSVGGAHTALNQRFEIVQ